MLALKALSRFDCCFGSLSIDGRGRFWRLVDWFGNWLNVFNYDLSFFFSDVTGVEPASRLISRVFHEKLINTLG